MKLYNHKIGDNQPVYCIAEIGVNHGGNLNLAKKMINEAKKAKASAVKFQTFFAEDFVTKKTKKVKYQTKNSPKNETHFQMIKSLEMSKEKHKSLIKYCRKKKIDFISTPYNLSAAKLLHELGCKVFKTASADIIDLEMHDFLAKKNKKVIISTGMSSMEEIDDCIKIYKNYKNKNFVLLHCVSNYPCNLNSINLNCLELIKNRYNCLVGYSDHSLGNTSALTSVALGACIVEKHFTINKNLSGPDHRTSALPNEFLNLVDSINEVKKILGQKIKKCQKEEIDMKKISRKSLTILKNLKKGTRLTKDFLTLKRPGTGLYYKDIKKVIGLKTKKNLFKDTQISLKDFYR